MPVLPSLHGNQYRNKPAALRRATAFPPALDLADVGRIEMVDSPGNETIKARAIGAKLTQGDGTVFDVRAFDQIMARSVNGGDDFAELMNSIAILS